MLFHAARLAARIDSNGAAVLLEDQDRSQWDRSLIQIAESWLARAKTERPEPVHYEATIAMLHCRADSVAETDWPQIVRLYDDLLELLDSPIYALNRAIALGEAGEPERALEVLAALRHRKELRRYPLVGCAIARIHSSRGDIEQARRALEQVLASGEAAEHERALVRRKLEALTEQ